MISDKVETDVNVRSPAVNVGGCCRLLPWGPRRLQALTAGQTPSSLPQQSQMWSGKWPRLLIHPTPGAECWGHMTLSVKIALFVSEKENFDIWPFKDQRGFDSKRHAPLQGSYFVWQLSSILWLLTSTTVAVSNNRKNYKIQTLRYSVVLSVNVFFFFPTDFPEWFKVCQTG